MVSKVSSGKITTRISSSSCIFKKNPSFYLIFIGNLRFVVLEIIEQSIGTFWKDFNCKSTIWLSLNFPTSNQNIFSRLISGCNFICPVSFKIYNLFLKNFQLENHNTIFLQFLYVQREKIFFSDIYCVILLIVIYRKSSLWK